MLQGCEKCQLKSLISLMSVEKLRKLETGEAAWKELIKELNVAYKQQ